MKHLPIALLVVLLTTALAVGLAFAVDKPAEKAAPVETAQIIGAPESCSASFYQPIVASPLRGVVVAGPLDCDCNRPEDCQSVCGDGGSGGCFIGPLCNNFPDYTGKCQCAKEVRPIEL